MEPVQIINDLKAALKDVKSNGQETVSIDALDKYLEDLRAGADQSIELRKLEYQRTLAYYDAETKHSIEMFKSVSSLAEKL